MSSREPEPHLSILDARLAEIDRRLSTIQTGLAEDEAALAADAPGPAAERFEQPSPPSTQGPPQSTQGPPRSAAIPEAPAPVPPARPAAHSEHVSVLHDQKRAQRRSRDRSAQGEATQSEPGGDRQINAELVDRLYELASSQQRVLESMRELLGAHEQVLRAGGAAAGSAGPVSVSAGPFVSTDALRDFENALRTLPRVRGVELRAFEGGDRAILDVHLA